LPDPGHLSALCIGMLALGFFLISNLRIFRIPAMACSKVDEFLEARPFSFALPNESDFPRDAKVRDRAKSDGIDAELLLQTLLAWLRANPLCARWFRSLSRPMKTPAAVCESGQNSLQSGSASSIASAPSWRLWALVTVPLPPV
jgi:hypothetical protein